MQLKLNGIIAVIFLLLGSYLGYKLAPKQSGQPAVVKQEEKKSGTITKKTVIKPDGTKQIDEIETYLSDRKNEHKVISDKKTTWSLIPKYSFENNSVSYAASYSYNGLGLYVSSDRQVGIVLSLSY